jgi:hypothetical protein
MKRSSRRSSKAWNYGKCNPDPLPGWPRRSPLKTEPHIDYSGSQIPHPITVFIVTRDTRWTLRPDFEIEIGQGE